MAATHLLHLHDDLLMATSHPHVSPEAIAEHLHQTNEPTIVIAPPASRMGKSKMRLHPMGPTAATLGTRSPHDAQPMSAISAPGPSHLGQLPNRRPSMSSRTSSNGAV
ncbi:hypothetical protein AMAG_18640 [Allomyces macrogynus ATCC 38327]|uniref:Uncharacterized protein n=1 Tax=Allomyces macrogynus (strain ATCC 38327) TaxID=578462 RepID=A0A0L0SG68_ALLM3|nr:hypothetical protein AMAG_18640 [Allomyces macrogynus ATCC 38327]|eukprot:KNE61488.1 hypothetical protein AMAG_18640 [Allomyces macrogynus ATCC 38327]